MTAPELLLEIEVRGGVVTVAPTENDTPTIIIAPQGLVGDLAPDIRHLKPQLIKLLESQPVHRWREPPTIAENIVGESPAQRPTFANWPQKSSGRSAAIG